MMSSAYVINKQVEPSISSSLVIGVSNITYASGPTYVGTGSAKLLFPFTLSNGVLDITPINGFNLTGGTLPGNAGTTVTLSGSQSMVMNIGPNFKTYIKNCVWGSRTISNVNSISLHNRPYVTKIQQLNESFVGSMNSVATVVSTNAPPSNFAIGLTGYGYSYGFLTPLVVKATDSSNATFYITFITSWIK